METESATTYYMLSKPGRRKKIVPPGVKILKIDTYDYKKPHICTRRPVWGSVLVSRPLDLFEQFTYTLIPAREGEMDEDYYQ